jgi:nucleotide-binding universal stress UspA family protein
LKITPDEAHKKLAFCRSLLYAFSDRSKWNESMNAAGKSFKSDAILKALANLGYQLGQGRTIELAIVGGAAGLLVHVLPGSVTTSDVDAICFRPPDGVEEILRAADLVADQQGIAKGWLNTEAGLFVNAMPPAWENRRVDIGTFGRLQVFAISRADLIAMKFYAHRERDLEHLAKIKITRDELAFTTTYLHTLVVRLPQEQSKINMALYILKNWTPTP